MTTSVTSIDWRKLWKVTVNVADCPLLNDVATKFGVVTVNPRNDGFGGVAKQRNDQ